MEDLRIVLIVAGLIAIGGLLGHGVWSSQKNRSSIKKKIKPIVPAQGSRDSNGFDDDGVGPVRKVTDNERQEPVLSSDEYELDPLFTDDQFVDAESQAEIKAASQAKGDEVAELEPERDMMSSAEPQAKAKPAPSHRGKDSEFEQPEPGVSAHLEPEFSAISAIDDELELQVLQAIEPEAEPQKDAEPVSAARAKPEPAKPVVPQGDPDVPPQVFVLYVEAAEGLYIHGDHLLNAALPLGLRFGFMDFFHRDVESNGTSERIYSMANMLKPGTFNMDSISELRTRGVSLFMHVPGPHDPIRAHTQMLSDAQSLAQELGCRVLDAQRNPLSEQSINYDQQRIREHLLQARLAQVETEH